MKKSIPLIVAIPTVVLIASIPTIMLVGGPGARASASGKSSGPSSQQPPVQKSPSGKIPRAVLIGWDGADRDRIREYMQAGELPHLSKLAGDGTLVAIDILRTTDTKAGWSQILTGYEPERTGVFNNWRYKPIPKGYTIFERLEDHYGADRFVTVAVIGKSNNLGNGGPKMIPSNGKKKPKGVKDQNKEIRIVEVDGKHYESVPGKPYFRTAKSLDVWENGLKKDEKVGKRAIELLEKYADGPFFFFVHFGQIDNAGHHHGENSPKQRKAYRSADHWLGEIVRTLEDLDIYDDTLVYVTSDHGFDKGQKQHKDAPYVFLATNDDDVIRRGERADVAPTIMQQMGLDLSEMQPPLDGHPLTEPWTSPTW